MKTIQEIRNELSSRILTLRSLERVTFSNKFQEIYAELEERERERLLESICEGDKIAVSNLLNKNKSYELMSFRELRRIAQRESIPNYNFYKKDQLITLIEKKNEEALANTNSQSA